jgi:hypothetical protein
VAFCTLLEFEDLDLDRYAEMAARGSHDGLPDGCLARIVSMRVTTDRGFGFARISPSG